jgi:acyl-CoA synthetase (AMP-forming)/AMP-acid ligase II
MNLADVFADHARTRPHKPALVDGPRTITYGELDPLIRRTANHLRTLGAGPGVLVGSALADNADHMVVILALARLGAPLLPLDIRWTPVEKARVTEFFDAKLILREANDPPIGGAVRDAGLDAAWHTGVAAQGTAGDFPTDGEMPLLLSLSSGTTGIPKGPMVSHARFMARFAIQRKSLGFTDDLTYMLATPAYFGAGRSFALGPLNIGATLVLYPPPYTPEDLAAAINEQKIDVTLLVPTTLRKLLEIAKPGEYLLPGLKTLFSTGAMLHPAERREVLARLTPTYINYYGSTEGGGLSVLRPTDPVEADDSVGRTVDSMTVEIVDESDQRVPPGTIGRIRYAGPPVATGFYRNPEASAAAFRDGYFYPGDLGKLDERGYLYITGRVKDVIIRGGVNIYPEEIEQTLLLHAGVKDCAVVAWPSKARGEDIAAFVVPKTGLQPDAESLRAWCRDSLASYKIPRGVFFVEDLPRNAFGKVKKTELAERLTPVE